MGHDPYAGILCGMENEYAIHAVGGSDLDLAAGLIASRPGLWIGQWGQDGSRTYVDMGDHPEYATPECPENDVESAAIYDRVGEQVLLEAAEKLAANSGLGRRLLLVKNGTDGFNYWGSHENYLVARGSFTDKAYRDEMMAYLVTRQIFSGSGMVHPTSADYYYSISQRSEAFRTDVSSESTRNRPIIHTRDEPHADTSIWRRIHLITGEPNILFAPNQNKVRLTALLFRMLSLGQLRGVSILSPVRAARVINEDWNEPVGVIVRGRRQKMTAVEIQYQYYLQACMFVSRYPNPLYNRALKWWHFVLSNLAQNRLEPLVGQLDWVTKGDMLEKHAEKLKRHLTPAEAGRACIAYHTLRGLRAIAPAQRAKYDPAWLDRRVRHAMFRPPSSRARTRGKLVAAIAQHGPYTGVQLNQMNWSETSVIVGKKTKVIRMLDPFATNNRSVDHVINYMRERL